MRRHTRKGWFVDPKPTRAKPLSHGANMQVATFGTTPLVTNLHAAPGDVEWIRQALCNEPGRAAEEEPVRRRDVPV